MSLKPRIEAAISSAIRLGQAGSPPPKLAAALDYAVNPGGARIRPTICMSVSLACGDDQPAMANAAATAIELIHCASLVHDDMPCFDNADTRRGKPSVHRAYGEPLALLTGDSLIIMAFEVWTELGARIGEAFQVADDLRDALYDEATLGKPAHQDEINGRPNAVAALGVRGAIRRLEDILSGAISSIPSCAGEAALAALVRKTAERLTPVLPANQMI